MSSIRQRHNFLTFVGPAMLLVLSACVPQRTAHSEADVLAAQATRFRAIVAANTAVLDEILAPDLVYTHSHGGVESKAEFMTALSSGSVDYLDLTPENAQARIYGDTAVVNGDVKLRVVAAGQEHILAMRFTEVYVHREGRWQLVSWQSTGMP